MKWSLSLGSISGIKIKVHWTFIFIIAWVVYSYANRGVELPGILMGVGLVLAVFDGIYDDQKCIEKI